MTEWRTCQDFPDYEVSEFGAVRRLTACARAPAGYVFVPRADKDGYLRVGLRANGVRKGRAVHQLVAKAFLGAAPSPAHEVAHRDGSKQNNHFTNLRWATTLENQRDRFRHGTHNRGEQHPQSKLNATDIERIRDRYRAGQSQTAIARDFQVTKNHIGHVVHGKAWNHSVADVANG